VFDLYIFDLTKSFPKNRLSLIHSISAEPDPELQDPEATVKDPPKAGFAERAMRAVWQPIKNAFSSWGKAFNAGENCAGGAC